MSYIVGKSYVIPTTQVGISMNVERHRIHIEPWNDYSGCVPLLMDRPTTDEYPLSPEAMPHLHVDWRFASRELMEKVLSLYPGREVVMLVEIFSKVGIRLPIKNKRMKCLQESPTVDYLIFRDSTPFTSQFTCHKLGKTCPHKGVKRDAMIERHLLCNDGQYHDVLVCPGHGLIWDKKTGKSLQLHNEVLI